MLAILSLTEPRRLRAFFCYFLWPVWSPSLSCLQCFAQTPSHPVASLHHIHFFPLLSFYCNIPPAFVFLWSVTWNIQCKERRTNYIFLLILSSGVFKNCTGLLHQPSLPPALPGLGAGKRSTWSCLWQPNAVTIEEFSAKLSLPHIQV